MHRWRVRCESTLPTVIRPGNSLLTSLALAFLIGPIQSRANSSPTSSTDTSGSAPTIDVVIVGPGDAFYTVFGHTALIVRDSQTQPLSEAKVYNFGVTKLGDPAFLYRFIMGESVYWGNRRSYAYQLEKWTRNDRTTRRYRLQVSPETARAIKSDLNRMVAKDNREFIYDLFRVNCVTKVRDLIDDHIGGIMKTRWSHSVDTETFRKRSESAYSNHPLFYFAFQWVLGRKMDSKPNGYLKSGDPIAFEVRLKELKDKSGKPVVGAAVYDHRRTGPQPIGNQVRWYPISLSLISLLALCLAALRRRLPAHFCGALMITSGFLFGLFAAALMYLQVCSQWLEMRQNLLLLMVWPTDLIICKTGWRILRGKNKPSRFIIGYLKLHLGVSMGLMGLGFIVNDLSGPILPRLTLTAIWAMVLVLSLIHLQDSKTPTRDIPQNP
ncbi:MAG: hypothetical protein CMH52_11495 [Myxococcales bacterium]|nr:hypothetical protein [Myxococcales bacterium]